MSPEGGPEQQKKGGSGLKWLAIGCVVVLLVGGGCVVGGYLLLRGLGSELYKDSVTKLQKHTVVIEKLGEPLEFGSLTSANIKNNEGSVTFPVKGPKGEGTVTVTGTKTGGKWKIDGIVVTITKTGEVIKVSGAEAPAVPVPPNGKKP